MRRWASLAVVATLSACSHGRGDVIRSLAHQVPASARIVVALDGARVRGTWLATSARALRALVPGDRDCLVDAALAADRALVAELATGRLLVIATHKVDCRALSQIEGGIWLATLDGATAPGPEEPRLVDRPDFAALRTQILSAPIVAVAPDGEPGAGVIAAAATIADPAHASLSIELDTDDHVHAAEVWLRAAIADAAGRLGDAGGLIQSTVVKVDGRTITATLATDPATAARAGPIAIVAAVAGLAARRAAPAVTGAVCAATPWPVTCDAGVRFELKAALRPTIEAALRAAHPVLRISGGQPDGVRIGSVADDSVLAALGIRSGDAVIAIDGRRLDSAEAASDAAGRLQDARSLEVTIHRGATTFEFHYRVN